MKIFLIFLFSFISIVVSVLDTTDPTFISTFKPTPITDGNKINFPPAGSNVRVNYEASINNVIFDSTRTTNSPITFALGQGQVIPCLDQVIARMSLGQRIKVICPSNLAYDIQAPGDPIRENSNITFDLELVWYSGAPIPTS